MDEVDDRELEALRSRAYGPGADIHLDPEALRRLKELEGERRRRERAPFSETPPEPAVEAAVRPEPVDPEEPEVEHPARLLLRRLSRVRRSTALIALGAVALATTVTTALTLVERVQGDPLQTGATQIARLSLDEAYELPSFFPITAAAEGDVKGFEEFHGIRAVVGITGYYGIGSDDRCLYIYAEDDVTDSDSRPFSGPLLAGCAAGAFPAMTQFPTDTAAFSDELRSAFPEQTALQFVYDAEHQEIVVFADR